MTHIKETKEVVSLLGALAATIKNISADGKINGLDLLDFLGLLPSIKPAVDGLALVGGELADLDASERRDLAEHVKAQFSVLPQNAQEVADRLTLMAEHLAALVALLQSTKKKRKK